MHGSDFRYSSVPYRFCAWIYASYYYTLEQTHIKVLILASKLLFTSI